jgi:DNA-directed RNA polymerase subunit RPC12/RpoP
MKDGKVTCSRCGSEISDHNSSFVNGRLIYCSKCTAELLTPRINSLIPDQEPELYGDFFVIDSHKFNDALDRYSTLEEKLEYCNLLSDELFEGCFCKGTPDGLDWHTLKLKFNVLSEFIELLNDKLPDVINSITENAALTTGIKIGHKEKAASTVGAVKAAI